ncbi:uncharacterized protein LOC136074254 [Hydra vulgaris]|uniref:Uncharacterized protein LOC136074254 n=1 Tax=Hydra vulgaris TaxID=6087 RepID=A0ABM4B1G8_HYDVU
MLVSYSWIKMVITVGILMCVFAYLFLFSSFEMTSDANRIQAPEGLKVNGRNFTLKREKFRIMSGFMHYFRIPFRKWSDRLLKLKAMGLNTVDIYIPWNLHEPEPGYFDFSSDQLNLSEFLYLLQGYGLYAIIRLGPYICAELDLGGLPRSISSANGNWVAILCDINIINDETKLSLFAFPHAFGSCNTSDIDFCNCCTKDGDPDAVAISST